MYKTYMHLCTKAGMVAPYLPGGILFLLQFASAQDTKRHLAGGEVSSLQDDYDTFLGQLQQQQHQRYGGRYPDAPSATALTCTRCRFDQVEARRCCSNLGRCCPYVRTGESYPPTSEFYPPPGQPIYNKPGHCPSDPFVGRRRRKREMNPGFDSFSSDKRFTRGYAYPPKEILERGDIYGYGSGRYPYDPGQCAYDNDCPANRKCCADRNAVRRCVDPNYAYYGPYRSTSSDTPKLPKWTTLLLFWLISTRS